MLKASREKPTVHTAVEDVIASGQQLLVDRLDLLRLEVREGVESTLKDIAMVILATIVGFTGWAALTAAAISGLNLVMPLPLACLLVGAPYLGGAIYVLARQGRSKEAEKLQRLLTAQQRSKRVD